MRIFSFFILLGFFNICYSQPDVESIEYHNKHLVDLLNKEMGLDYKYSKIGKNKRGFGYSAKKIYVTSWKKLNRKTKKELKEIFEDYSESEIEGIYNELHFFNQIHAGLHSFESKYHRKTIKEMNKNLHRTEELCNELMIAYWSSLPEYEERFAKLRSTIIDVVESNEELKDPDNFKKPNKSRKKYWRYFLNYMYHSFKKEATPNLDEVIHKLASYKDNFEG